MLRPLLLSLVVALVAGVALWTLGAGGTDAAREPAVVQLGQGSVDAPAGLAELAHPGASAAAADSTPLLLTVDPLTAARAASARRPSSVPRLDRVDRALLRWDDGSPVAGALVDVAAGPFRRAYDMLKPDDPPAVRSDAEGRVDFRQLYAGQQHLAIVSHPDLLGVAAVRFELPADEHPRAQALELVVARPSTLVVEGLDWPDRRALRLSQRLDVGDSRPAESVAATLLTERRLESERSVTFEGLARGSVVELTLLGADGVPLAEARATMVADVERVSLSVAGTQPVGQSRGFSWRLMDSRGRAVTLARMRAAGLAISPAVTLTAASGESELATLRATGDRYAGVLRTRLEPPWHAALVLHGLQVEVGDIEPGDEVELQLTPELMAESGALVRFAAAGGLHVLGRVEVESAAGSWRDVDVGSPAMGEAPEGRVVLPPGSYSWRAWDRDLRAADEGRLSVSADEAARGDEREVWVTLGATTTLSGTLAVLGAGVSDPPAVVLVSQAEAWRPQLGRRSYASGEHYRLESVLPGDYEIVVIVQREGQTLSLPAGPITLGPGEVERDVVVSLPVEAGQRSVTVTSPLASSAWIAVTDGRGRRLVYEVRLRTWAWDRVLGRQTGGEPIAATLAVPPGFERYEAWAQAGADGWWRASGALPADALELVPDEAR